MNDSVVFFILYQIFTENATIFREYLPDICLFSQIYHRPPPFFEQIREIHIFPFKYGRKYIIMYVYYWLFLICANFCKSSILRYIILPSLSEVSHGNT